MPADDANEVQKALDGKGEMPFWPEAATGLLAGIKTKFTSSTESLRTDLAALSVTLRKAAKDTVAHPNDNERDSLGDDAERATAIAASLADRRAAKDKRTKDEASAKRDVADAKRQEESRKQAAKRWGIPRCGDADAVRCRAHDGGIADRGGRVRHAPLGS